MILLGSYYNYEGRSQEEVLSYLYIIPYHRVGRLWTNSLHALVHGS